MADKVVEIAGTPRPQYVITLRQLPANDSNPLVFTMGKIVGNKVELKCDEVLQLQVNTNLAVKSCRDAVRDYVIFDPHTDNCSYKSITEIGILMDRNTSPYVQFNLALLAPGRDKADKANFVTVRANNHHWTWLDLTSFGIAKRVV